MKTEPEGKTMLEWTEEVEKAAEQLQSVLRGLSLPDATVLLSVALGDALLQSSHPVKLMLSVFDSISKMVSTTEEEPGLGADEPTNLKDEKDHLLLVFYTLTHALTEKWGINPDQTVLSGGLLKGGKVVGSERITVTELLRRTCAALGIGIDEIPNPSTMH